MPQQAVVLYQGALDYALKRIRTSQKPPLVNLKSILDDEELDEDLRGQLS